ncbi:MAG: cob(I)yrinic acid a,c-diamide adenosyltransferase [Tannerellaceae bacterium]|jgi:cob(I)alamin adenosyltransferase|nr:cob(I)yrinic acid a,c-diamide adenosyltransferase [Tannerellaceae bacterium]
MKHSKIYTRGGDGGTTSLAGGPRLPKSALRIEAYGSIDELNSFTGLLAAETDSPRDASFLHDVQRALFTLGSWLAVDPASEYRSAIRLSPEILTQLEDEIDLIDNSLPRLKSFVLPGGNRSAATAHVCRTVCRRAERIICRLFETEESNALVSAYINRLSDYFFVFARQECLKNKGGELFWEQ